MEQFACPLAVNLVVDYLGDLVFWFSVDDYRCWQRFGVLLEGVGCGWFEHRDMEYRMGSPHGVQKAECEGLRTGLGNYFIWSEVLFREFLRWASRPEVL